jgi:hypothetical protein
MEWLAPGPGRFTPGKETRYPLYRRLGGPQGRSGQVRKISPQPGFDPRTVQPVASRYIDYAIPAHRNSTVCLNSHVLSKSSLMLRSAVKFPALRPKTRKMLLQPKVS